MTRPRAPATLDEQICFSLYGASMAVTRAYKPILDRLGITYPQYLVLNVLWERDQRPVGAIAERLALEPSTLTPLVKRLEAAGLLARRRNPDDERQVVVSLTEAGHALRAESACLGDTLLSAAGMPLDRIRALNAEIQALRDAVVSSHGKQA